MVSLNAVNKITEFNHTDHAYDRTETVSDMFDEMVRKIPDHTAVVYKDKTYTHKELDDISDRLGR